MSFTFVATATGAAAATSNDESDNILIHDFCVPIFVFIQWNLLVCGFRPAHFCVCVHLALSLFLSICFLIHCIPFHPILLYCIVCAFVCVSEYLCGFSILCAMKVNQFNELEYIHGVDILCSMYIVHKY